MSTRAQKRAVKNYRTRLRDKGMRRYEVLGLATDQKLVRLIAKRLSENDAKAKRLRADLARAAATETGRRGGILDAFRTSPLVGADIRFEREPFPARDVDI